MSSRRCLFVVFAALSAALLLTNFGVIRVRSEAARGRRIAPQGTAKNQQQAATDYDIRQDKSGKEKVSARRERLSAQQKEKTNEMLRLSSGAQEAFVDGVPGLRLVMSDTLKAPESVVSIEGQRFLTRPSNQAHEKIVRDFLGAHAAVYGLTPAEVGQLKKSADYVNPDGNLAWV